MRTRLALAISALACGLAAPATAAPLFDEFRAACIESQAKPAVVEAHAKSGGWMPMPEAMLQSLAEAYKTKTASGWVKSGPAGTYLMVAATAPLPLLDGQTANVCAVGVAPAEVSAEQALMNWAAVPKWEGFAPGQGASAYVFVAEGAEHVRVPRDVSDNEADVLLKGGKVTFAISQSNTQMTMLGLFMVPK